MAKSHLILKNQYVRKLISLRYICRNEFSPIRIILKLTFLFQLFPKFRENVIWPVKAKSTLSAKIFFRETLWGFYIEIDNSAYFQRVTTDFGKTITLSGKISWGKTFVGKNFRHLAMISSFFSNKNCYLYMKKANIWKKVTSITKPHEFSKIFVLYKISYDRI